MDDNADAANMLRFFLEAAGHQVEVAHMAEDAMARAQMTQPQLCLIDIGLPGVDGNELARRLRKLPALAASRLIAVTGYGRQQDREASMQAGFDHYFVKPLDTGQLLALIADRPGF